MRTRPPGERLYEPDMREGYRDVVRRVLLMGEPSAPRGEPTRELIGATIVVPGDAPMLPVHCARGVSTKLAAVEATQFVGGYSDADQLLAANPRLAQYTDDGPQGAHFHGAYGPRIRGQVLSAMARLEADPATRRAVVRIWDPELDLFAGEHFRNYPCKTELQLMVRGGALDLHVRMRANDVWHGLAYDAFVANQLQWTVARMLKLPVGWYVHHAASLHLYERDVDAARTMLGAEAVAGGRRLAPFLPQGYASLSAAYAAGRSPVFEPADDGERWYVERLRLKGDE